MSRRWTHFTCAALLAFGFVTTPAGVGLAEHRAESALVAQPAGPPNLQALQRARGRVASMRARVGSILRVLGETHCSALTSRESCAESPFGCAWNSRSERCQSGGGPENDLLAVSALLVIQGELFQLGERIDQAIAAYPGPAYVALVAQACVLAQTIEARASLGQNLAAIPVVGLVTPAEFVAILQESNAVQFDLGCP